MAKEERVARVERAKKQSLVARKMGREQSKKNHQFVLFAQDQFTPHSQNVENAIHSAKAFESKFVKNLLSRTRLVRLF